MGVFDFLKCLKRPIRPYDEGHLPARDGHRIYYQQVGNPRGEVVLSFHGGPGSSSSPEYAGIFNLKKYRVILFDQRACGRSLFKDAFHKNTIQDTMADAVRLLDHLNVAGKIIACGASFGATCATLFAQTHPRRVKQVVLVSVFLGRKRDTALFGSSAPLFYPDAVDVFRAQAGRKSVDDYYHALIFSPDKADQKKALRYYGSFEHRLGDAAVAFDAPELTDEAVLKFRIVMHYTKHNMFLTDGQLIKNASKMAHIPTIIYQNRLDFCCPPYQAYDLHKALPQSRLVLFADTGHGSPKLYRRVRRDFD
ncbi:MAG: alpha/beta fold hydrolase [Alphaproteobacteria bacterium]|nr:alpha/beta fold hydrolase [Alphaproteobacteria bacterium]